MDNNKSINKQFSKEHLSSVLEAMIRVKGGEVDDYELGICFNTSQIVGDDDCVAYDVIEYLSPKWHKSTGNPLTPIPYVCGNKWTGEYGQLRYELLDFLIEELTKAVGEYDEE